jgi:hypothetical protein
MTAASNMAMAEGPTTGAGRHAASPATEPAESAGYGYGTVKLFCIPIEVKKREKLFIQSAIISSLHQFFFV